MPVNTSFNSNSEILVTVRRASAPAAESYRFSLQRHHYLYLHTSHSEDVNSIIHHDLSPESLLAELRELGERVEVAPPPGPPRDLTLRSNRVYRVEVGHFYVIGGPRVWSGLSREQWITARTVRQFRHVLDTQRSQLGGATWQQIMESAYKEWSQASAPARESLRRNLMQRPLIRDLDRLLELFRRHRMHLDERDLLATSGERTLIEEIRFYLRSQRTFRGSA